MRQKSTINVFIETGWHKKNLLIPNMDKNASFQLLIHTGKMTLKRNI